MGYLIVIRFVHCSHLSLSLFEASCGYIHIDHLPGAMAVSPASSWAFRWHSRHLLLWKTGCEESTFESTVPTGWTENANIAGASTWSCWLSWRPSALSCGEFDWNWRLAGGAHCKLRIHSRRLAVYWQYASRWLANARQLSCEWCSNPLQIYLFNWIKSLIFF